MKYLYCSLLPLIAGCNAMCDLPQPDVATSTASTSEPVSTKPNRSLVGTWTLRNSTSLRVPGDVFMMISYRHIRINADGTFKDWSTTDSSNSVHNGMARRARLGTVTQNGNVLTFNYSNGNPKRWVARFQLHGRDGIRFNGGQMYLRSAS